MSLETMKRAAAAEALKLVEDGMKLGLGTGSTARHFVDLLGEKVRAGMKVVGVPTSEATRLQASGLSIPLADLSDLVSLDLTIDGADEIDGELNLVKGGGGAHLREKIVASASKRMIVIADQTKIVKSLGKFPLPVEVVKFGEGATVAAITAAFTAEGLNVSLRPRNRADGSRFITDEGNFILDGYLVGPDGQDSGQRIVKPGSLAIRLASIPGVIEHGLFVGNCSTAFVASETGVVRLTRTA